MTKLVSAIIGSALGLTLAASVSVGVVVGSNDQAYEAKAADAVYAQAIFNADNNNASVNSYTESWTNTTNGFTWNLSNFNNNGNGWDYVKCGSKSAASTGTIETANVVTVAITKVTIDINAYTKKYVSSITLYGGSNGTTSLGTFTKGTGTQTITITNPSANQKYKIEVVCSKSKSNGPFTLGGVSLYYDDAVASVSVDKTEIKMGTNESDGQVVTATTKNITSPTYLWTTSSEDISLENETTNAVTIKPAGNTSTTAEVTLTVGGTSPALTSTVTVTLVKQPYTVADARAAIDAGENLENVLTSGIVCQVDSYNSTYSSITYWISDDGTTNNMLEVYSGKGLDNADFASIDDVQVGAIVTIYGTLKLYNTTYEYDKNNYLTSYVLKTVTGLTLSGAMNKTLYSDGSEWNPAGFTVTATFNDGTAQDFTAACTWSFDPATPTLGVTSVVATASYGGFSVSSEAQDVAVSTTPYTNGIPYKMYFVNTSTNKTYYFIGSMSSYFGATSETKSDGVDVYLKVLPPVDKTSIS